MYCSNCGCQVNNPGYCPNCGNPVGQYQNPYNNYEYNQNVNPNGYNKGSFTVGAIVIVFAVIVFFALLVIFIVSSFLFDAAYSAVEKEQAEQQESEVYIPPITYDTQTIKFGSYTATIALDYEYDVTDDSLTFYNDERSYELSVIKTEYARIKMAKKTLAGTSKIGSSTLTITNVEEKTVRGKEIIELTGTLDKDNAIMIYTTSNVISRYTVGFMCYGDLTNKNKIYDEAITIIDSIELYKDISEINEDID